jgi:PHD-finger
MGEKCMLLNNSNRHRVFVILFNLLTIGTSRKRRQPDETHFCNICSRSISPGNNRLVFCDNCDTPYHQHCHQPPVSDETVASNNKWFCSTCKPPTALEDFNTRMIGQGMTSGQVIFNILLFLITETSIITDSKPQSTGRPHHICF